MKGFNPHMFHLAQGILNALVELINKIDGRYENDYLSKVDRKADGRRILLEKPRL